MLATPIRSDHLPRLLAAAGTSRSPARDVALVRFTAETGARPCELAALTWRSFVDAGGTLTGRARWQTAKRGAVRDVALSEPTLKAIAALYGRVAGRVSLDAPVFTSERRSAFKAQSMRHHLRSLAGKAGLSCSGYSLRHMALSEEAKAVIAAGGTGATLMRFSGHKSLSSVQHYLDAHDATIAECDRARAQRATY
jgi:integrase